MQPQSGVNPAHNTGERPIAKQVPRGKDEKDFEKRVKECLKLSGSLTGLRLGRMWNGESRSADDSGRGPCGSVGGGSSPAVVMPAETLPPRSRLARCRWARARGTAGPAPPVSFARLETRTKEFDICDLYLAGQEPCPDECERALGGRCKLRARARERVSRGAILVVVANIQMRTLKSGGKVPCERTAHGLVDPKRCGNWFDTLIR
ncbi:hypothetical protein FNV43_RR20899 [Rhamnella rubrinervis]|uniref:Uncharacterized protein n=1 Tax=Rhamnella rubrinervis TaxID=2594499 RepID=A0A8K0DZN5_9ROSA|nr:hypothetical protein FNV43_RR20899 [Rhamnella rubrinervis]